MPYIFLGSPPSGLTMIDALACIMLTSQFSETMVYGDIWASEQKEAGMLKSLSTRKSF